MSGSTSGDWKRKSIKDLSAPVLDSTKESVPSLDLLTKTRAPDGNSAILRARSGWAPVQGGRSP